MHEISSYKRPIPPMKTRVPKTLSRNAWSANWSRFACLQFRVIRTLGTLTTRDLVHFQAVRRSQVPNLRISTPVRDTRSSKGSRADPIPAPEKAALRCCRTIAMRGPLNGLFIGFETKALRIGVYPLCLCGCSSMVELQPSKLITRVRFPSPAPEMPRPRHCDGAVFFSGAPSRNRTYNLRIRSPLLYPLSHGRLTFAGVARSQAIIAHLLAQQTSKTNPRPQRSKAPLFAGAALPYPHVSRM